jgi:hypothetical protein
VAAPVATVPVAEPVPPAPPAGLAFNPAPHGMVTRRTRKPPKRKRGAGRVIFVGVLALFAAGALAAGAWGLWLLLGQNEEDEQTTQRKQGNFAYLIPGGWKRDQKIEQRLAVHLAIRNKKSSCGMGLFFRDYKTRSPSEAELVDVALEKLRGKQVRGRQSAPYFRAVEYNNPFSSAQKEPAGSLGGHPAWVLTFRATENSDDGAEVEGEVHMLAHRGYAYWLFTWGSGERELLVPDWEEARRGFRILDGRQGWKEKPRETLPFTGTAYELRFAKDLWKPENNPRDYDEHAELVLRGFEPTFDEETGKPTKVELAAKAATVQVLLLPRAGDLKAAVAAADAHLLKKQQETFPKTALARALNSRTGKPEQDGVTDVGAFRGQLTQFHIKNDGTEEGRQRYGLRTAVKVDAGVLVIFGECEWDRRAFWDHEFKQVLERVVRPRVSDPNLPSEPKRPKKKAKKPAD